MNIYLYFKNRNPKCFKLQFHDKLLHKINEINTIMFIFKLQSKVKYGRLKQLNTRLSEISVLQHIPSHFFISDMLAT